MKTLLLAAAVAALAAAPALADHGPKKDAHSHAAPAAKSMLKASSPASGATVSGSPKTLTLTFVHPMTLKTVALTGPSGKTVAVPVAAAGPRAHTSVALPALAPGAWRAAYKAVAADGHAATGLVRFTVR
ncbi:MAG TPA: copper resistance CopC family protein [Caulobacteraceae bacterium]|jgi:methionine-rich copper-binding protein CopC